MTEEFYIDESQGDVFDHVYKQATGYPDRVFLRSQNQLAHSREVAPAVRIGAQRYMGRVAARYGLEAYAKLARSIVIC